MRKATVKRVTSETSIEILINLDGSGDYKVKTDVPFLTHMLELFSKHGLFDLEVKATGDVEVDYHHLIEDVGIVLGEVVKRALGSKKSINRYGFFTLPMDETLISVAVDLSGRPYFVYKGFPQMATLMGIEFDLFREFWKSFAFSLECNLHINCHYGLNLHHIAEGTFKCVARALKMAVDIDEKIKGIPSTKGKL
ncbi:Imidazoleglycerol-phosphate dehydratase [Desulfurobacterium thermolithotrophum DSM 11699]|uniref:Imidazoleglycerol-phosphate dehydratase n=1 Tax=Desulfurobacterium thermolithotrophum (strain DSM 11699 / BSA) TaxID=868864 RepID=F0S1W3_DESTD|nr:imidazoleglycerol-phosphate dehydratase HisB [Desulfurobacterium thermolithotrophum]ADY74044.1 Imidazoleglycerol-phosphate dehydratase [Desulfurobacterium thermolithotrophum DSM 11699]